MKWVIWPDRIYSGDPLLFLLIKVLYCKMHNPSFSRDIVATSRRAGGSILESCKLPEPRPPELPTTGEGTLTRNPSAPQMGPSLRSHVNKSWVGALTFLLKGQSPGTQQAGLSSCTRRQINSRDCLARCCLGDKNRWFRSAQDKQFLYTVWEHEYEHSSSTWSEQGGRK